LARLPEHRLFPAIHGRLVAGESPYHLARWIQSQVPLDDPLGSATITGDSLERKLRRYRALMPQHMLIPPTHIDSLMRGSFLEIDVVREFTGLILYQKQRIEQFASKEKDWPLGITSEQQRKEVLTLAQLLKDMRDTQIALGITPGTLPNQITVTSEGPDHDVQQDPLSLFLASNPQAIPMVMGALEQLIIEGKSKRIASGDEQEKPDGAESEPGPRPDAERGPTQRFGAD
jgi:hypothetical protein